MYFCAYAELLCEVKFHGKSVLKIHLLGPSDRLESNFETRRTAILKHGYGVIGPLNNVRRAVLALSISVSLKLCEDFLDGCLREGIIERITNATREGERRIASLPLRIQVVDDASDLTKGRTL